MADRAARFWATIFAFNFLFGVITGIPIEFQFGTNWAKFSHYSGGVIATALAMEGVFAFFLESSFLGLFLYGEKRWGRSGTGSRPSWSSSAHGCRATSSSSLTRGCSTPSAMSWRRTARSIS